jgi:hypothetical protein
MHGSEMAKLKIDDMVRDAEAYRRSRETRSSRTGDRRGKFRRAASSVISALLWPIRH